MLRLLGVAAACCCCHLLLFLLRLLSLGANMSSVSLSPPAAAPAGPFLLRALCAVDATAFCRAARDLRKGGKQPHNVQHSFCTSVGESSDTDILVLSDSYQTASYKATCKL